MCVHWLRRLCDQRQLAGWTLGSQPSLRSKQKRPHRDPTHGQTMFVPDEPFTYSCIPLSLSFGGSSLRGRRLRRWGSTGSWVSGAVSNQQPATHKESGDIIFRSLLPVSDQHAVCLSCIWTSRPVLTKLGMSVFIIRDHPYILPF